MFGLHEFVDRVSGKVVRESLPGDRAIDYLYSVIQENAPKTFKLFTSRKASQVLALLNYDLQLNRRNSKEFRSNLDALSECVKSMDEIDTPRKFFERQIRYWELRPMPDSLNAVTSPADSKVLMGSLSEVSNIFIKEKFFSLETLLGLDKPKWSDVFRDGDFAVFRLTPEKYHYNHTPVAGTVVDFYEVEGDHHSCNPGALVRQATAYSTNRRAITIVNSDVPRGTGVGMVAMVEIVALMIGEVRQCYSENRYDSPRPVEVGLFLNKGLPKSLFRPGSSTVVLIFQRNRVEFAPDLIANLNRTDVRSRFSMGFGKSLVETDVKVRSRISSGIFGADNQEPAMKE